MMPLPTIRWLIAVFALSIPVWAHAQETARVIVTVHGVRNSKGSILVAICSRAEFLKTTCDHVGRAPAETGDVAVTIADVPFGTYAAQAYHDENDNRRLDTSWLGIPEEGLGFSNDAPFRYGPPAFDDAAFTLTKPDYGLTLSLRYFD
jgi:uncharacterized protein (DUF2141 family)